MQQNTYIERANMRQYIQNIFICIIKNIPFEYIYLLLDQFIMMFQLSRRQP